MTGIVGPGAAFDSLEFTGTNTNAFLAKIAFAPTIDIRHNRVSPSTIQLYPNYPNPFNPSTTIRFELRESGPARLILYDVLGRAVRTLIDDRRSEGIHAAVWDGRDDKGQLLPSGVYIGRLTAGGESSVQKMILLK